MIWAINGDYMFQNRPFCVINRLMISILLIFVIFSIYFLKCLKI